MRPIRITSALSAALSALNGFIIMGNDFLFGAKSSLPVVSGIAGIVFILIGYLIWQLGSSLSRLQIWVMPGGGEIYRQLSLWLGAVLGLNGILMLSVMFGLYGRIAQGFSIFG